MATEGGAEGGDALTPERGSDSSGAPPGSAAAESALLSEAEAWLTQADGVGQSAGEGPSLHSVAKLKVREGRRRGATTSTSRCSFTKRNSASRGSMSARQCTSPPAL